MESFSFELAIIHDDDVERAEQILHIEEIRFHRYPDSKTIHVLAERARDAEDLMKESGIEFEWTESETYR
jgi:hypothetical protein